MSETKNKRFNCPQCERRGKPPVAMTLDEARRHVVHVHPERAIEMISIGRCDRLAMAAAMRITSDGSP